MHSRGIILQFNVIRIHNTRIHGPTHYIPINNKTRVRNINIPTIWPTSHLLFKPQ